jgi:hypothetical protein
MTTPFTSNEILLRTRSFRSLKLPAAAAALGLAATLGGRVPVPMLKPLIAVGVTLFMLGLTLSFVLLVLGMLGAGAKETAGELVADDEGVDFAGRRLVNRADLTEGLLVPFASKQGLPLVALSTKRGGSHELVVRDEAQGRELLRAIGLDASQSVAHFKLPWRHIRAAIFGVFGLVLAVSIVLAMAGVITGGALLVMLRFLAPLLAVIPMLALRSKLAVGADGILLTELGRKRFLSYRDITDVRVVPYGLGRHRALAIGLQSGETLSFPLTSTSWRDRTEAVAERIREARDTYERGDASPGATVLERGKRPMTDWIRALRAAGSGASADARTAAVEPTRLWRILEDPSGDPKARVAAAIALGPSLDADGRARLVAASEASASPKLRIALSAAAAPSQDSDLEQALAELEAELDATDAPAAANA